LPAFVTFSVIVLGCGCQREPTRASVQPTAASALRSAPLPRCDGPALPLSAAIAVRIIAAPDLDHAVVASAQRAIGDAGEAFGLQLHVVVDPSVALPTPFRVRLDALSAASDAATAARLQGKLLGPLQSMITELSRPGVVTVAILDVLVPPDAAAAVVLQEVDGLAFSHVTAAAPSPGIGSVAPPMGGGPVILLDGRQLAHADRLAAAQLAAHELGHLLGLVHPSGAARAGDVMARGQRCLGGLDAAQRAAVVNSGALLQLGGGLERDAVERRPAPG
jgi:hypothetical protein